MNDDVVALEAFLDLIGCRGDHWEAYDKNRKGELTGHSATWDTKKSGMSRKTYALSQHETAVHHDVVQRASLLAQQAVQAKDKGLKTTDPVRAAHHASIANAALREVHHLASALGRASADRQTPEQKAHEAALSQHYMAAREAAGAIVAHARALKMAHAAAHG